MNWPGITVAAAFLPFAGGVWAQSSWLAEVKGFSFAPSTDSPPVVVCLHVPANRANAVRGTHWEVFADGLSSDILPAQYEGGGARTNGGLLWWLMSSIASSEKWVRVREVSNPLSAPMRVRVDQERGCYDIMEGDKPVLRFNHGVVPVPEGIPTNYARGDYIMPLYGLDGEMLAADYPKDHPHHRGLGWSWPVTRWGREVRDIWAVSGVWARPVSVSRVESGPVFALLEVESAWKWGDTLPIVREQVTIRAFRLVGHHRLVDIEVRLVALVDEVAIGGRPQGGYGGFGLRAQPASQRVITRFVDPAEAGVRRSWLDYSGVFPGTAVPSGLAILEHPANPFYPNTLLEYPELNYVMPAFPGEREVSLSRQHPLVLRHRVWIHRGMASSASLDAVCRAYHYPVEAVFRPTQESVR